MTNRYRLARCLAAYLMVACILFQGFVSIYGQQPRLKNGVTVSGVGWAFVGSSKYLGVGVEYTRQQLAWLGADVGFVSLPSRQAAGTRTDYFGPGVAAAYGGLRFGHSFNGDYVRADVLLRGGSGVTRGIQNVSPQGQVTDKLRTFPILGVGAQVSLRLARHVSSTYTFVNNTVFFQPFPIILLAAPAQSAAFTGQTQEYKAGLQFRF